MKEKNVQITVPSKDLIQIWRINQKLYRQAKAKKIKQHPTSPTRNPKGTSLGGKEKAQLETGKLGVIKETESKVRKSFTNKYDIIFSIQGSKTEKDKYMILLICGI